MSVAVPIWGQTTLIPSSLYRKRDCSPKGVNTTVLAGRHKERKLRQKEENASHLCEIDGAVGKVRERSVPDASELRRVRLFPEKRVSPTARPRDVGKDENLRSEVVRVALRYHDNIPGTYSVPNHEGAFVCMLFRTFNQNGLSIQEQRGTPMFQKQDMNSHAEKKKNEAVRSKIHSTLILASLVRYY